MKSMRNNNVGKTFRTTQVPAETEKYLTYRYGKHWRTPIKKYIPFEKDSFYNIK